MTPLLAPQSPFNRTSFNPIPPGLFGGGSKTINDNEMKFGGVVKDH